MHVLYLYIALSFNNAYFLLNFSQVKLYNFTGLNTKEEQKFQFLTFYNWFILLVCTKYRFSSLQREE